MENQFLHSRTYIAAIIIYNQMKAFDSTIEKALGTLNKNSKAKSNFGTQKTISFSKNLKLLACSIYFDFNIPQMIRYLGTVINILEMIAM